MKQGIIFDSSKILISPLVEAELLCVHCLSTSHSLLFDSELQNYFCCSGCKEVYRFILSEGLESYYKSRTISSLDHENPFHFLRPKESQFHYTSWDSPEFLKIYCVESSSPFVELRFYVEGIRCVACTWLLSKLPEKFPELKVVESSLSRQLLIFKYDPSKLKLSDVARYIDNLGYKLHPLESENDESIQRQKEDHRELLRLGISFFFSSQIMVLAVAIYSGADQNWRRLFEVLSLVYSIPVIFYGAAAFFKNFYKQFKIGYFGLDGSMSLALIMGFSFSCVNFFNNKEGQYFDSISMFVTLILASRFLARKLNQHSFSINFLPFNQKITLYFLSERKTLVEAGKIKVGDKYFLGAGQMLPVDSSLISPRAFLDQSQISGESRPQEFKKDSKLLSGSINLGSEIELIALNNFSNSFLGSYLKRLTQSWGDKCTSSQLSDVVARKLIALSVFLGIIVFFLFYRSLGVVEAFQRSLAVLIVTCPCALALGTPLAFTLTLKKLFKQGIFVKGPEVLERLAQVKNIFFDKTGTLTEGKLKVKAIDGLDKFDLSIIYRLEKNSQHPIAKTLVTHLSNLVEDSEIQIDEFKEHPGLGLEGTVKGRKYYLRAAEDSDADQTKISFFCEDNYRGSISFQDFERHNAKTFIAELSKDYPVHLLSGDRAEVVADFAKKMNISESSTFANHNPYMKRKILQDKAPALMVGDGLNDALSFKEATVSVAFHEALALSQKCADVVIQSNSLESLVYLLKVSKKVFIITKSNLTISIVYNILGLVLAILGIVTPLIAAILMPLSSFSILLNSYLRTKDKYGAVA